VSISPFFSRGPSRPASLVALVTTVASFVGAGAGCGDDGATTGSGGAGDDGLYRPAKSGVAIPEDEACANLRGAIEGTATKLGCIVTVQACPNLVRALGGEACSTYDEGTIDGCATYYAESSSCDELATRRDDCVYETAGSGTCP
jgi:hypothetical protein